MSKPLAIPGLLASLEKHFTRELANVPTPDAVETYEFADDEVAPEGGQAWPVRQEDDPS